MNVGIVCASVPAMPMFFRQHKLELPSLYSLKYRLFGKSDGASSRTPAKSKYFRGISLKMTSPSLGMKSNLGKKGEDWAELEEGHDQKPLAT